MEWEGVPPSQLGLSTQTPPNLPDVPPQGSRVLVQPQEGRSTEDSVTRDWEGDPQLLTGSEKPLRVP